PDPMTPNPRRSPEGATEAASHDGTVAPSGLCRLFTACDPGLAPRAIDERPFGARGRDSQICNSTSAPSLFSLLPLRLCVRASRRINRLSSVFLLPRTAPEGTI